MNEEIKHMDFEELLKRINYSKKELENELMYLRTYKKELLDCIKILREKLFNAYQELHIEECYDD